jgi:hypothetical protein
MGWHERKKAEQVLCQRVQRPSLQQVSALVRDLPQLSRLLVLQELVLSICIS